MLQTDGGYLGLDFEAFFSAVVSGAAGIYVVTLTADAGIGTDLVTEPGQDVRISGDPGLVVAPSWGSGGFAVAERVQLSLSYLVLSESGAITFVGSGGTIGLASLALPATVLTALIDTAKIMAGVTLHFSNGFTTGGTTVIGASTLTSDGHGRFVGSGTDGVFVATSGPCITSQGGRCVGRHYSEQVPWPGGGDSGTGGGGIVERCEIFVLGAGTLRQSPLFDTVSYGPGGGYPFNARHDAVGLGGASCA
eukprot:COSAG02_NODE_8214_length_2656_cov_2.452269_1_plen_249_part_10